jgi:hypothetical protein
VVSCAIPRPAATRIAPAVLGFALAACSSGDLVLEHAGTIVVQAEVRQG